MVNLKKISLLFVLCFMAINVSFGATETLYQCPSSMNSDTEYILDETFSFNTLDCFDMTGLNNVVIDGENNEFDISIHTRGIIDNSNNITIKNLELTGDMFYLETSNINTNILFNNNKFKFDNSYKTFTQGSVNRDIFGFVFLNTGAKIDLTLTDNYIKNQPILLVNGGHYNGVIVGDELVGSWTGSNLTLINNDLFTEGLFGCGSSYNGQITMDSIFIQNNNFGISSQHDLFLDISLSSCGQIFFSNNFVGNIELTDDNFDGISSNSPSLSVSGCTIYNTNFKYLSEIRNSQKKDFQNEYFLSVPVPTPFLLDSNTHYYFSGYQRELNSSVYFDFSNVFGSTLDLRNLVVTSYLDITNTRVFQMGNNNYLTNTNEYEEYANIRTSGTISIFDSGYYTNNWHLIEYVNGLEISNINFDLNAVDDYGLVRKKNSASDGLGFQFINNIVDYNFVPNSPTNRPQFLVGAFTYAKDNIFYLPSNVNVSVFGGGISGNTGGGHYFTNNEFYGGGHLFRLLADVLFEGDNFESYFIHNKFGQEGSGLYALPFDPSVISSNLLINPNLNGSYFYKTTCTNYEFNLGNWYEDWDDSGWYNDTNADGIHDSYNGIDYILRGYDYEDNEIKDYRSPTPYPFDFASNTGTATNVYDTCLSFSYNINTPTEQNYTSGYDLVSDWEFISTGYPEMICFEYLNDYTTIYNPVMSGENKGLSYDLTDGQGVFKLKCCDTPACENIVKESETINFCVGDCDLGLLSVISVEEPTTTISGCTDSSATNYNPSATNDDGSCTYASGDGDPITSGSVGGIFSSDFDNSGDTIAGIFNLATTPLQWAIVIGFIFIFLAMLSLLFAGVMYLVK